MLRRILSNDHMPIFAMLSLPLGFFFAMIINWSIKPPAEVIAPVSEHFTCTENVLVDRFDDGRVIITIRR